MLIYSIITIQTNLDMTSLRERRQSFNSGLTSPRIVIPSNDIKDAIQLDSTSPTLSVNSPNLSGSLSPEFQPTLTSLPVPLPNPSLNGSGSLSPELQPITPPVLSGQRQGVLQIGRYLLVEELDSNVHKAVNIHSGEEKICKVRLHLLIRGGPNDIIDQTSLFGDVLCIHLVTQLIIITSLLGLMSMADLLSFCHRYLLKKPTDQR